MQKGIFMSKNKILLICALLATIGTLTSCATFGGRSDRGAVADTEFNPDQTRAEQRLREIVREHIQAEQRVTDASNAPIVRRRPYYFREYSVYPDGLNGFVIDFREIDSRIRPLMAEVKINKIRYSTRMHRKRNAAESDTDFLRDTGEETLVFELRSGRWTRVGAIFNAHKTEEMVNGQWAPRKDETLRVIPTEDRPGRFRRFWLRIRGDE